MTLVLLNDTPECIINLIMFLIVHPQYCYGQSIDYTINHPSIHLSLSLSLNVFFFLLCRSTCLTVMTPDCMIEKSLICHVLAELETARSICFSSRLFRKGSTVVYICYVHKKCSARNMCVCVCVCVCMIHDFSFAKMNA